MGIFSIRDVHGYIKIQSALERASEDPTPQNKLEAMKQMVKYGSKYAPPGIKQVVRGTLMPAIETGLEGAKTIQDYRRDLERVASELGVPGTTAPDSGALPPGFEYQPTIVVSDDGESF